jgi:hypothetical protein
MIIKVSHFDDDRRKVSRELELFHFIITAELL